ncbi:Hvo_1808 family surface protein [Natribaculum luteum]|uniref:Hvo_1808 family surface protein n=1 Tax=Natribaculum luteum TaxID=1586232 RepID=A0ABD5NWD4_9EURY|nr:Hvo_1808 family surface protein [Natribaculum luteum]
MRRVSLVVVVALVVLAGCTAPISDAEDELDGDRELGRVGDYNATDTIEIDGSGPLTEDEREAVKHRAMARIEEIRGLEFEEDVELEVVNREEYRERWQQDRDPASQFTNELWRGAFVVDGETDVNEAFDELYGDSILGYYSDGRIVLVVDDDDRIDRTTLVHELVHALQDQQFGLGSGGATIDERRATTGLAEGEAEYVPSLYDERCGEQWECLDAATPDTAPPDQRSFNAGLFLSVYTPYAEGPTFVAHRHETTGWEGVDAVHEDPPTSTAQLIHPERYPEARPADVTVEDRSTSEWEPLTDDGERRTETVGEATLFATLWSNGVIGRPLGEGSGEYSRYNYSHPATDGWAGDTFVAYGDGNETGHVWKLAWESEGDAREFRDAYVEVLESQGADAVDSADGVYRIPDDEEFAGAYRVDLEGDEVVIVGAPTVTDLEAIHRPSPTSTAIAPAAPPTAPTPEATSRTGAPADASVPVNP